ncbi:hypothetical protein COMA2_10185 [Candidatus Nitrospira nitrificans]|uniref:Uncharacterized protein n=1 Tax=Candidatus Nitrospira nitrificans TaxID=1742973 RepID=A0A0S4L1M8_9BACT|nr:hypothetical protein COMA2_10185 [Candidatus Nitrospira nitrificans]
MDVDSRLHLAEFEFRIEQSPFETNLA